MPWCHEPLYTSKFVHLSVADRALYLKAALFHHADCPALGSQRWPPSAHRVSSGWGVLEFRWQVSLHTGGHSSRLTKRLPSFFWMLLSSQTLVAPGFVRDFGC